MKKNELFQGLAFFVLLALLSPQMGWAQWIEVKVIDEESKEPAPNVEIRIISGKHGKIFTGPTDKDGSLPIPADIFEEGEDLEIYATKTGTYTEQKKLLVLAKDFKQNKVEFKMVTTDGNRTTIRVFNPKTKKPVPGVIIKYLNHVGKIEPDTTDKDGQASFLIHLEAGTPIDFYVEKCGYAESPVLFRETLTKGGSVFRFELKRQRKFPKSKRFLFGAGAAGVIGGTLEHFSRKAYSDYKDYSNEGRENDYSSANTFRRTAIVTVGAGLVSLVLWKIYRNREKRSCQ